MTRAERDQTLPEPEPMETDALDAPRCQLGEGPAHDPATGTAWWFDILGRCLYEHRFTGTGTGTQAHALPFMASAMALTDDGRQILAAEDGLHLRVPQDGSLRPYLPLEADDPRTRSNDARTHPSGTFWVSTAGREGERGAGCIYAVRGTEVTRIFSGMTMPNAICFQADGATGYFADTSEGTIHRVPLDPRTGLPAGEASVLARHAGDGAPDGAVVDHEGRIWNACFGAGLLHVYSPEGALLRRLGLAARQPSCPAFIGPRLDRLLVTTAYDGMDEAARAQDPHHGRVLLLDPGTTGRPEPRFRMG